MANAQLPADSEVLMHIQSPSKFATRDTLDLKSSSKTMTWQPSNLKCAAVSLSDHLTVLKTSDEDARADISQGLRLALNEAVPTLGDQAVKAPFEYVSSLPSKGVRSTAIDALNHWYEVPPGKLEKITDVINSLHNASLMLDDIEDNSPLRRGYPATHQIFNRASTINSANFVVAETLGLVCRHLDPKCLDIYAEELRLLYIGQSWDLYWTNYVHCPSVADYMSSIDYKTGGLFRMACRMMEAESEAKIPAISYVIALLGRYFQIRDDYQNLESPEYTNKKGVCEDLDEGKFSLPLIHCMNHHSSDLLLGGLLQERRVTRTMSLAAKQLMLEQLDKTQSQTYTRRILDGIFSRIQTEVTRVEQVMGKENPKLRAVLDKLVIV